MTTQTTEQEPTLELDMETRQRLLWIAAEHARELRLLEAVGLHHTQLAQQRNEERLAILAAVKTWERQRAERESTERAQAEAFKAEQALREAEHTAAVAACVAFLRQALSQGERPRDEVLDAARAYDLIDRVDDDSMPMSRPYRYIRSRALFEACRTLSVVQYVGALGERVWTTGWVAPHTQTEPVSF